MLTSTTGTLRTIGTSMYNGGTIYTYESAYRLDIMAIIRSGTILVYIGGKLFGKQKFSHTVKYSPCIFSLL